MKRCTLFILCGTLGLFLSLNSARAQVTVFTYQGNLTLNNGTPLTGFFDMQFKLHPGPTTTNQIGSSVVNPAVGVTNGLFTVPLDFGSVIFNGNVTNWLEIGVRTNGSAAPYTILAPFQQLGAAPYAIYAIQAGTAAAASGTILDSQLSTNVAKFSGSGGVFTGPVTLNNGSGNFNGALSGTFNGAATGSFNGTGTINGTNMGTFIGNGAGITNINITNVVGLVPGNPTWQVVQGTSQQAQVATEYLATNAALTTLTLPANPGVGNTVRLSGSGLGGWIIVQNAGQSILTGSLGLPAGKLWTTSSSLTKPWSAIASSANGSKMVAAVNGELLYTSTDGGQSWTSRASSLAWVSVASSADGTHLAAAVSSGNIFTSTNSGTNWTASGAPSLAWSSVASSADGTKLVAVVNNGSIYTSVNSGTNWTVHSISKPWSSVASSADGTKLAAVANGDNIYMSANSGTTWTTNTSLGTLAWRSISSSADGSHLVAAVNGGFIYTSTDSGANWTQHATSQPWASVSSSASGANLVAVVNVGLIYTSFDGGLNWISRTAGTPAWSAATISGDGTRAAATINGGQINFSQSATTVSAGSLSGSQYSAIELQHVGNGIWIPLSFNGNISGL